MSLPGETDSGSIAYTRTDGSICHIGRILSDDFLIPNTQNSPYSRELIPLAAPSNHIEFCAAQAALYKSLVVVTEEEVPPAMVGRVSFLTTSVCQSTQVDHATIQSISPQFNGCVRNHPSTLFKLCSFISAGEPVMTRNQLNEHYQGVFVDEEINLLLVGLHCPGADFNQTNVFKAFALLCK